MNVLVQRAIDKIMSAFVGSGVSLDDHGRLALPDGLSSECVHRFIEVCLDERFESRREALHALFLCLGVKASTVRLLNEIVDSDGGVALSAAARRTPALIATLPEFTRIPARFRDFLVHDLELASGDCTTLEEAVASARESAAMQLGSPATWDAILDRPAALADLTQGWRKRARAA